MHVYTNTCILYPDVPNRRLILSYNSIHANNHTSSVIMYFSGIKFIAFHINCYVTQYPHCTVHTIHTYIYMYVCTVYANI